MPLHKHDKRPSRRRNLEALDSDIDILPVLNMFLILVPFLLLTAAFIHIAIIESTLTQIGQAEQERKKEEAEKKEKLHLTLAITNEGYTLGSANKVLNENVAVPTPTPLDRMVVPKTEGKFDYKTLTTAFAEIKSKFPHEDTLIITAAPQILYEEIINAMDCARFRYVESESGLRLKEVMFPNIVVASQTIVREVIQ